MPTAKMASQETLTVEAVKGELDRIDAEVKALQVERQSWVKKLSRLRGRVDFSSRTPTEEEKDQNAARAQVRAQKGRALKDLRQAETDLNDARRRALELPEEEREDLESEVAALEERRDTLRRRVATLTERLASEFGYPH